MLSDVPGYPWDTIMAMAQAGIRYFSMAPNNNDRIGTLRLCWHDRPFWAASPSGKEKVLVWIPGRGYPSGPHLMKTWLLDVRKFWDSIDYPYGLAYIRGPDTATMAYESSDMRICSGLE